MLARANRRYGHYCAQIGGEGESFAGRRLNGTYLGVRPRALGLVITVFRVRSTHWVEAVLMARFATALGRTRRLWGRLCSEQGSPGEGADGCFRRAWAQKGTSNLDSRACATRRDRSMDRHSLGDTTARAWAAEQTGVRIRNDTVGRKLGAGEVRRGEVLQVISGRFVQMASVLLAGAEWTLCGRWTDWLFEIRW